MPVLPMRNVEDPVRVERLFVPPQGFGMFGMIEGSPEFRGFVRAHAGRNIAPKGAPRIYVSRLALPAQRGSVLGERRGGGGVWGRPEHHQSEEPSDEYGQRDSEPVARPW